MSLVLLDVVSGWVLVVAFNVVTAAAYLGIVLFIVRGLRRTRQLRNNRLAVATAAIFLTCSAHHVLHAWHLVASSGANADHMGMASMRESMGGTIDVAVTAGTAIVGVAYLGLRRSYGRLLGSPSMFDSGSESRYRQLAANLPHTVVLIVDTNLRFVLIEGAGLDAAGYDRTKMEGRLLRDSVPPEMYDHLRPYYQAAVDGHESQFDSISDVTGAIFEVRARPMFDGPDRIVGAMVLAEDVTAERAVKKELERAREFRDAVLTASPDVITVTDVPTGRLTWASRSLSSLLDGPRARDMPPRNGWDSADGNAEDLTDPVVLPDDVDGVRAADRDAASLPDGDSLTVRYRVLDDAGRTRWLSRRSTPFRRERSGDAEQVLSVVREVTDVVEAERALERAALQDPLTGLPNRLLLLDRIDSAIDRTDRAGSVAAVLFCDLDGFKSVNDTGGHAAGDAVLIEVARRLRSILRAGDSIARVGGDEFVLVVGAFPAGAEAGPRTGRTAVDSVVERIRSALSSPIEYDGREYVVSASIGMVLVQAGTSAHEVLRDADLAMYRAKMLGKNRIEIFDDSRVM